MPCHTGLARCATRALVVTATLLVVAGPTATAEASFPGRNGKLVVTADAVCRGDAGRYLRLFSPRGGNLGALTSPCVVAFRDPDPVIGDVVRETFSPAWTPDGSRLLFRQSDAEPEQRMTIAADGSDPRPVPVPPDSGDASLSPDGQRLALIRSKPHWAVWTQAIDGTQSRELGQLAMPADIKGFGEWLTPRWSPDGRFVALVADSWGNPSRVNGVWLMSATTGKLLRRVAKDGLDPDWSPEGRKLVYATEYSLQEPEDAVRVTGGNLYVVSRDGTRRRRLLHTRRTAATAPTYSPDGKTIAWVSLRIRGAIDDVSVAASIQRRSANGRGRPRRLARLPRPIVESEDASFNEPTLAWQPLP